MPRLDSPRHEAFAQRIAKGESGAEAYREVYGDQVSNPRGLASDLLKDNPDISERVVELQAEGAKGVVMSLQTSLEYLTRVVTTPAGQVTEESDLCQSYKHTLTENSIKMPDKLKALELLSKLTGRLSDLKVKHEHTGSIEHVISEEARMAIVEKRRAALLRRQAEIAASQPAVTGAN